jgi:hypothetical protein
MNKSIVQEQEAANDLSRAACTLMRYKEEKHLWQNLENAVNRFDAARQARLNDMMTQQNREEELAQLLQSACAIALREGEETHWGRFLASARQLGITGVTARTYRLLEGEDKGTER